MTTKISEEEEWPTLRYDDLDFKIKKDKKIKKKERRHNIDVRNIKSIEDAEDWEEWGLSLIHI